MLVSPNLEFQVRQIDPPSSIGTYCAECVGGLDVVYDYYLQTDDNTTYTLTYYSLDAVKYLEPLLYPKLEKI